MMTRSAQPMERPLPGAVHPLLLVRSPYGLRAVAVGLVVTMVASLSALLLAPWQQNVRASGRVVAYAPMERQQTLEAPLEGRVVRWLVREGARVAAGDLVVELADNDPGLMDRLHRERDAANDRLHAANTRVEAIDGRILSLSGSRGAAVSAAGSRTAMARDRVRAAEQALHAAQATLRTAELNQVRQRALLDKGLTSTRALEVAELEVLRSHTEADRARGSVSAARSEGVALRSDQRRVGTDASAQHAEARSARAAALSEVASARAELARIEVRLARQHSQRVTAPRAGSILRLVGGQGGEVVKAGDPLAILVPDTQERAAEIWVDGSDAPLLSEGRTVRLQFEGWPAVQFVGWPSIAVGTFPGRVALVDATDNGKGKFRVLVVPDPAASQPWPSGRYLRQGVRVNAWVLLNRVRLGYELWRQWNGFPPAVASSEPGSDGKQPEVK
ncbi:MAG TPA: HlyD family efflux transporter periplasmic adaptor subunit [Pseudomonadota bacterium]|nr:HlyD family efflux transporter periplasmic adaptor subunit [Pseudomonadota bacterium]